MKKSRDRLVKHEFDCFGLGLGLGLWLGFPGNPTGRGLTPKVKEIAPSGFLQNVRLVKVTLPPQEENLGQPRF